jgi:hypothetical protein
MADDILGHEHLDHGKHLHHGHGHHGPKHGYYLGYWLRHPSDHHAHAHHHQEHTHSHNTSWSWQYLVIAAAVIVPFALLIYRQVPGFALALLFLAANTLLEQHKWYTGGLALDMELLSVGVAYLTVLQMQVWAIALICCGPIVAQLSRGQLNEYAFIRMFSLIAVFLTALSIGSTAWGVFIAVLFGVSVYFFIALAKGEATMMQNIISRTSTLIPAAYVIFLLLPSL